MTITLTAAHLTRDEARALTDRIRATAESLCTLLSEAYRGQAHRALGFASWEEYVSAEFSMSRTYSYRLLAQARVIAELEQASGASNLSPMGDISERAAREIAPQIHEVATSVRERVAGGQEPREAVREAVQEARATRNGGRDADDDAHAPDLIKELEAAHREILRLQAENDSLAASDLGAEVRKWSARYAQMEARLQQALTTGNEAEKQARYATGLLKKIRGALGVEKDGEIMGRLSELAKTAVPA